MTLFHTPTAYLILGLLYFIMPTITWFVLTGHRTLAVKLWCGGGILVGLGFLLVAARGHVPAWATFPLANLLVFAYGMMRIQSLRIDLTVPWHWEWMTAAALLFVFVLESIRLGLGNLTLMAIYNHSIFTVLSAYLAALALRLAHQEQSPSVRWIAYAYFFIAGSMLYGIIAFSIGWDSPLPNALESNSVRLIVGIVALPGVVIAHIAYIGFILERTHRQTIKMEHELRASEARFRSYFELPLTGRAITSPSMGWVEVNATLCDMLGYSETELTQMTWAELTHPDDLVADLAQFNRLMAGEIDGYILEKRFIHKHGQSIPTHLAVHCLRKPDQSVDYFIALILDISDWRRAEESLRESKARYDELVRHIPVGIFTLRLSSDGTLSFEYCSEKFCQILGLDERDVLRDAESVFGLIHPDDRASMDEANQYAAQTLEPFRWEGRFLLVGETRWLRIESEPTLLPNGDSLWNGVINDITENRRTSHQLRLIQFAVDKLTDEVFIIRSDTSFHYVNDAASRMLEYSHEELLTMAVPDIDPVYNKAVAEVSWQAIKDAGSLSLESQHRTRSGRIFPVEIHNNFIEYEGEGYVCNISRDITDRKQAEQALKSSEERLRLITDIAPVFLAEIDKELCYRFVNRRYAELFGLPPEEFCGKRVNTIMPEQAFAVAQPFMLKALAGQLVEFETELPHSPGGHQFMAARYAPRHDDTGQVIGFVAAITNITERKRAEEEIKQLAFYDHLTQLPNRRLLLDRLQQAMVNSDRNKTHGALLFIDLDNFKTLNDTLGHDKGDLLLQQVASRITAGIRESDTVARFGGDEFVVMLTGLAGNIEEAATQAQKIGWKIIDNLNRTYSTASYEHYCSASIGITLFVGHGSSIDDLLKMADIAMYQAKAEGRNTLRIFEPRMQSSITARATLANDLHRALEKNQFKLYFQLEVGNNKKNIGVEALLRWDHPEHGLILPMEFIPLAEETGLINPIGQWVLESACALLKSWEKTPQRQHLYLAVNISMRQFQQPNFVDKVLEILRETGADPGRLMLELTENVVLADINQAIAIMTALKDSGVRFSLDHSGTGHSSFAHLVRLPFDQMKIDRSFVQNITLKPSDAAIIETIMVMAEKLGIAIVAEGVETEAQRAFLEKYGCPVYQGYLFGKPLPLVEFEGQFPLSRVHDQT